jgi:outer membrane protein assembly factor BamB
VAAAVPHGPFWPRFHGPEGDNLVRETGLAEQWPEGGPPLVWTARGIGEGYSSVSIAGGLIYTAGNLKDRTVITALDLDGRTRWRAAGGEPWTGPYPGTRGTPTVDADRVYHESPKGQIVCLQSKTGEELWTVNILEEYQAKNITWGLAESLVVDRERLICSPGGPFASLVALDKRTGRTVWTAPSTGERAGYASPLVIEHQGLRLILAMTQRALIGVNAEDGQLLFRHPHATRFDANATMPIYRQGRVFITSGYGSGSEMLRLARQGPKVAVETLWRSTELDNLHGGVILCDGRLYGAAHQAPGAGQTPWVCLDWNTGKRLYAARGVGRGSLTCADRRLYILGEDGRVGLVEARPDAHRLIGTFRLPGAGQAPAWSHPVVCAGRLYLRYGDTLYAYDVRGKQGAAGPRRCPSVVLLGSR